MVMRLLISKPVVDPWGPGGRPADHPWGAAPPKPEAREEPAPSGPIVPTRWQRRAATAKNWWSPPDWKPRNADQWAARWWNGN